MTLIATLSPTAKAASTTVETMPGALNSDVTNMATKATTDNTPAPSFTRYNPLASWRPNANCSAGVSRRPIEVLAGQGRPFLWWCVPRCGRVVRSGRLRGHRTASA